LNYIHIIGIIETIVHDDHNIYVRIAETTVLDFHNPPIHYKFEFEVIYIVYCAGYINIGLMWMSTEALDRVKVMDYK
jgi:hypothetical protein